MAIIMMNTPIIIGILRDSKMHKMHNIFIAGQAFSDLSLGITLFIFFAYSIANKKMLGNQHGCNIMGYAIVLTCHSTVFSLALIAHGRYHSIITNKKYTVYQCLLMILCFVWIPSYIICISYYLLSEVTFVCSGYYCNPLWNEYIIPICGFCLLTPSIYIVWVYRKIHIHVSKISDAVSTTIKYNKRLTTRDNMTKLMILMCVSIFIVWIPIYIFFIIRISDFATGNAQARNDIIEFGVGLGATISSLVSPILYVMKNKNLYIMMKYAFLPMEWKYKEIERISRVDDDKQNHNKIDNI